MYSVFFAYQHNDRPFALYLASVGPSATLGCLKSSEYASSLIPEPYEFLFAKRFLFYIKLCDNVADASSLPIVFVPSNNPHS